MTNISGFIYMVLKSTDYVLQKSVFYETVHCAVQRTLVHVYVRNKKLSLRAAVVANCPITASVYAMGVKSVDL